MGDEAKTIAERISLAQQHSGLTFRAFCKASGLSLSTFRRYTVDQDSPSYKNLMGIQRASKVGLVWLMTGEGEMRDDAAPPAAGTITAARRVQIRELARQAILLIEREEQRQGRELDAELRASMISELIAEGLTVGTYEVQAENVVELVKAARR